MINGKTKTDFEFSLPENVMDNMELVDALADMQGENPLAVSKVVRMVLGDEQRKRLYDHVRGDDGRVSVKAIEQEVVDIFQALGNQGKNF